MLQDDKSIDAQFEAEYSELFAYISRFVTFRIPHRSATEDVISDIFLYGYARRDTYDPTRGSMRQWFTGIAKRHIAEYWRTLRPTEALREAERVCNDAEYMLLNDALDAKHNVQEILESLSPEHRALFTLRYIDGMTHDEIAALVRKKPSTIRTFFSRALKSLRQDLIL